MSDACSESETPDELTIPDRRSGRAGAPRGAPFDRRAAAADPRGLRRPTGWSIWPTTASISELRDRLFERFTELTDQPTRRPRKPLNRGRHLVPARVDSAQHRDARSWPAGSRTSRSATSRRRWPPSPSCEEHRRTPRSTPKTSWPEGAESDFERDYLALGQQLHEAGLSLLRGVADGARAAQPHLRASHSSGGPHVFRAAALPPAERGSRSPRGALG